VVRGVATDSAKELRRVVEATKKHQRRSFLKRYVFSTDHKTIGIQFLLSSLVWFAVGGFLALAMRWQLAWPWSTIPLIGNWLFAADGGQIPPEFYNMLFTMHATIMIFFVVIPILSGGFGNYLIPLMIGAPDMAFPRLNMLSYWLMWPAFGCMVASFLMPGYGPGAGWTSYPPLSTVVDAAPNSGAAQSLWLLGLLFVGVSSMIGSINYITTIFQMRAPGLTLMRLPMTVWTLLISAVLQAFTLPVLTAALCMQLADRWLKTEFFAGPVWSGPTTAIGGGEPLLWQHLFWFYSHPAVYVMILPAMGMVSEMLSCFSRKPLFGYRMMVASVLAIAGLGFIVWGHHMFVSGMNNLLAVSFMVSTLLIALPSGVKVFNWLATLYGGRIQLTTAMLFSVGFVAMFVIGGLSGVVMAVPPVDIHIHDTYYIVGHIHFVLFGASMLGVMGAIYFWYPKMFGRMMNEWLGKLHFLGTFVSLNLTFLPMHFLGARGVLRRVATHNEVPEFAELMPLNEFITFAALAMGVVQLIFVYNFCTSLFWGKHAGSNPWRANTLEWQTDSPPSHDNFAVQICVERGPYEYSYPGANADYWPQSGWTLNDESEGGRISIR
jgi:cytochrome c oxidase subunit 1